MNIPIVKASQLWPLATESAWGSMSQLVRLMMAPESPKRRNKTSQLAKIKGGVGN